MDTNKPSPTGLVTVYRMFIALMEMLSASATVEQAMHKVNNLITAHGNEKKNDTGELHKLNRWRQILSHWVKLDAAKTLQEGLDEIKTVLKDTDCVIFDLTVERGHPILVITNLGVDMRRQRHVWVESKTAQQMVLYKLKHGNIKVVPLENYYGRISLRRNKDGKVLKTVEAPLPMIEIKPKWIEEGMKLSLLITNPVHAGKMREPRPFQLWYQGDVIGTGELYLDAGETQEWVVDAFSLPVDVKALNFVMPGMMDVNVTLPPYEGDAEAVPDHSAPWNIYCSWSVWNPGDLLVHIGLRAGYSPVIFGWTEIHPKSGIPFVEEVDYRPGGKPMQFIVFEQQPGNVIDIWINQNLITTLTAPEHEQATS